jgi:hypothetical protein
MISYILVNVYYHGYNNTSTKDFCSSLIIHDNLVQSMLLEDVCPIGSSSLHNSMFADNKLPGTSHLVVRDTSSICLRASKYITFTKITKKTYRLHQ